LLHLEQRIKRAVIKDNSISNQLNLSFYQSHKDQKVTIKLEIEVEPPAESGYRDSYLDFPTDYDVCHQNLSSNFALKIHALLCHRYVKGATAMTLIGISSRACHQICAFEKRVGAAWPLAGAE
jgi:hypothetical protein